MNLETACLELRNYHIEDLENYYKLKSCNEVWKYSTYIPLTDIIQAKEELEKNISMQSTKESVFCALFEKDTNNYIGEAGIISVNKNANRCVVGYNLLPCFWNKGYATEITRCLIAYAFNILRFERVEALADIQNIASCRVLEKSGMLREGVLKHFAKINDCYHDICYYGITIDVYFINEQNLEPDKLNWTSHYELSHN